MHAQWSRVASALMSFAVAFSTICTAQTQGLADPNAPAVGQSRAQHGRVMAPASSIAHAGDKGVRGRDPDLVLGELREQPQVGRDDGAERHRSCEQVSEDQEHVQQGNGFPGKGAGKRQIEP